MSGQLEGFRLSPRQQRIWLLGLKHGGLVAQLVLTIEGRLDAERLRGAISGVAAGFDVFNGTFRQTRGVLLPIWVAGEAPAPIDWRRVAGATLEQVASEEWQRPFDFEHGPLLRAALVQGETAGQGLVLTVPSLLADGVSLENLAHAIVGAYGADAAAAGRGDELLQYLQYAEWHHETLESAGGEGRKFWQQQIPAGTDTAPGLPEARTVEAGSEGSGANFRPAIVSARLEHEEAAALRSGAATLEAAPEEIVLAIWQMLLLRQRGGAPFPLALGLAGRRFEEFAGSVGAFANLVPLWVTHGPELTFRDILERARRQAADAEEWQELFTATDAATIEDVATVASLGFEPLLPERSWAVDAVTFCSHTPRVTLDPMALSLGVARTPAAVDLELRYDARVFDAATCERWLCRLRALLRNALAAPQVPWAELEILDRAEKRWLLEELNQTAVPRGSFCLHELVAEQARRCPEQIAVRSTAGELTFGELEHETEKLALRLRAHGLGPDDRVAIFIEHSPELVVALIATLKAGAAYVPLDPAHPAERLAFIIADAAPKVVLTAGAVAERLPTDDRPVLNLSEKGSASDPAAATASPARPGPDNLAYVLYTSGSTGQPKGVMVPHRGLVNYLSWAVDHYDVAAGSGVPVDTPVGFDLTVTGLFSPLLAGRPVLLLETFAGYGSVETSGVPSFVKMTPTHLELLRHGFELNGEPLPARVLILGGEALEGERLGFWRKRAPGLRIVNEYGPTETVVGCAFYEVPPGAPPQGAVPIGQPIANTRLYVLDETLRPAPTGMAGELFIAGPGVTRGYLSRPGRTAASFLPCPFATAPGDRMYRSGDLVHRQANGELVFLDRLDDQVKIRGYRIELGEIGATLSRCPGVREAVVVAEAASPGEKRLVAYLVAEAGTVPELETLRSWLAKRLPDYMLPAIFVPLDAFPVSPNGKVDRRALVSAGQGRLGLKGSYVVPSNPIEEILAGIWSESLGVEQVGATDNFFVLGGDSMRSVRIVSLARDRGLTFTVQDLFRNPTVATLASFVSANLGFNDDGAGSEEVDTDPETLAMLEELDGLSEAEVRALLKAQG